jgi:hypothetical protein
MHVQHRDRPWNPKGGLKASQLNEGCKAYSVEQRVIVLRLRFGRVFECVVYAAD